MTPDRGPDGRSLGHSHVEHVQPPNRGYAGYYLPNLYQENYRIRSAEELDALPHWSVVIAVGTGRPEVMTKRYELFEYGWGFMRASEDVLYRAEGEDQHLFLVYRPDMVPPRRDPA